jgi:hypothetical protein
LPPSRGPWPVLCRDRPSTSPHRPVVLLRLRGHELGVLHRQSSDLSLRPETPLTRPTSTGSRQRASHRTTSSVTARRVAWELAHGSLAPGVEVRACPDDKACVRIGDCHHVEVAAREPPAQERHVPRRVRIPAIAGVEGLLRPETSRRQAPQRHAHLPCPATLQRHPRHAPHRPALQPEPPPTPPRGCLNPLTTTWGHPPDTRSHRACPTSCVRA